MLLQAGERRTLDSLGLGERLELRVESDLSGTDYSLIGLQGGQLSDDRYMVFYNQPNSPEGALLLLSSGRFALDLPALPPSISEIYLTATHDHQPLSQAARLSVSMGDATFDAKPYLSAEKAVMLIRLYRHQGSWRLSPVAQGFNGGLAALVRHFGGEVLDEPAQNAPSPASSPASPTPSLSLVKERQRILLEKAERQQPALVSLIKQASVSLEKRGLGEARYRVNLVLDISASMQQQYKSGAVQRLAERALALATRLDDDGEVELYLFGEYAHRRGVISLDNIGGFIDKLGIHLEGGTDYSGVMRYVLDDAQSAGHKVPTLVLFITDGATSNQDQVVRLIIEASHQPVFWKFMGIDQAAQARGLFAGFARRMSEAGFQFLERLDDLQGRRVDNADFFRVTPAVDLPDSQMFDFLVNELDSWQREARALGILR